MKVLQIIPSFAVAGAEVMCENLIYELNREGVDVVAVSLYNLRTIITKRLEETGIRVYYLNKKRGIDKSVIPHLRKIIVDEKPDIIHVHLDILWYVVPAAIGVNNIPKIHTIHSEKLTINKITQIVNCFFYRFCEVYPVALNKKVQRSISRGYGIDESNIPVVNNGIDITKAKGKVNIKNHDKIVFVHVGRFSSVKNHENLLKAFRMLYAEYPECHLNLIGQGENKKKAEEYVEQNGLSEAVDFLGIRNPVFDDLSKADVFVLPSRYEGMPITILEAMATGLPIIASNVGGIPEVINNGINGVLCTPEVESIYEAMKTMVINDELREQCGKNALKDSALYSSNKMAREYISIYQNKKRKF